MKTHIHRTNLQLHLKIPQVCPATWLWFSSLFHRWRLWYVFLAARKLGSWRSTLQNKTQTPTKTIGHWNELEKTMQGHIMQNKTYHRHCSMVFCWLVNFWEWHGQPPTIQWFWTTTPDTAKDHGQFSQKSDISREISLTPKGSILLPVVHSLFVVALYPPLIENSWKLQTLSLSEICGSVCLGP